MPLEWIVVGELESKYKVINSNLIAFNIKKKKKKERKVNSTTQVF